LACQVRMRGMRVLLDRGLRKLDLWSRSVDWGCGLIIGRDVAECVAVFAAREFEDSVTRDGCI
jgi:hypothetical protein